MFGFTWEVQNVEIRESAGLLLPFDFKLYHCRSYLRVFTHTFDGYLRDKEHYTGEVRMKLVATRCIGKTKIIFGPYWSERANMLVSARGDHGPWK